MKHYIVAILFIMIVFARGQSQTDSLNKIIPIGEVVVSANKVEENRRNISRQIQTVDKSEIKQLNFRNTADVLQDKALVSVQKSQQGGGSPVIRGLEASRVLIIVDGVRMNNLIFRAGHLQNIITVDENILNKAEVLYGPASTVYGSDALGGVINLITLDPKLKENNGSTSSGDAYIRYSYVNNEKKAHVNINIGGAKLASLTSITYSNFGDLKMGANQNSNNDFFGGRPYYAERINGKDSLVKNSDSLIQKFSGYQQFDLMQKILYQQNNKIRHLVNVQYSATTDIPRYDRLTDPQDDGLKYAEWYYGPQNRLLAGYNFYGDNLFAGQNMHIGLHYQDVQESRHQRRFDRSALQHRVEDVNVVNFNADLNTKIGKGQLQYGFEAEFDKLKSTAQEEDITTGDETQLDTRYPNGDNTMYHTDLYATYEVVLKEKLAINAGLRIGRTALHSTINDTTFFTMPYSDIDQKNFTYSGSAGIAYNSNNNLKFLVNLSSGYRVPNIDDLAKIFETAPGAVIVPNSNLKPERTITVDGGFSLWINERIEWENTVFYTKLYDAIVTDDFTFNGQDSIVYDGTMSKVLANQNMQRANIYGYSGTLKIRLADKLGIYGNISFTKGNILTDTTDCPLDHIPPVYGNIGLRFESIKWFTDFSILFNGNKDISEYYLNGEENEQYAPAGGMPAWYTLNLKASYLINKHLTLQAGVENILDIQYRTFASGINSPGRNIYGTLRFSI
jgi:hemoglobin/transferrin/lactoferrin receptor protein